MVTFVRQVLACACLPWRSYNIYLFVVAVVLTITCTPHATMWHVAMCNPHALQMMLLQSNYISCATNYNILHPLRGNMRPTNNLIEVPSWAGLLALAKSTVSSTSTISTISTCPQYPQDPQYRPTASTISAMATISTLFLIPTPSRISIMSTMSTISTIFTISKY